MSDYAVVLQKKNTEGNYYIVKASNFGGVSDIGFTASGKVKTFTYNNINYYSVYNVSTGLFMDYVDTKQFEALKTNAQKKEGKQYEGVSVSVWNNPKANLNITFNSYASLIPAVAETKDANGTVVIPGDKIYAKLKDETGLCYNFYVWTYTTPYSGTPANPDKSVPGSSGIDCEVFADGSIAKGFYDSYKNYQFFDTSATNPRLVAQVASLLNSVEPKLRDAFKDFAALGINTGVFEFNTVVNQYSTQDLIDYANGLQKWLQIYNQNVDKLKTLQDVEQIYIICDVMCYYNTLGPLDVQLKIKVLSLLVNDVLTDWTKFSFINWQFQHRETLALRIVQSVTNDQASQFLQLLTSTIITSIKSVSGGEGGPGSPTEERNSLYKLLFKKINDFGGAPNFTAYIQKLNQLVLTDNGITSDDNHLSVAQIKEITEFQCFWGTDANKNKIKYSVLNRNDQTVTFQEQIAIETEIDQKYQVYYSSSVGTPVASFPETNVTYSTTQITLNHFDLVSIHFYDNPSFVDTTTDQSYNGKHFITFAGFIDYLIEKEDTHFVENIAQAALFAFTLAVGFGELLVAVRSLSLARAFVGAIIVTGDVSAYLSSNSAFRSYIQARYPNDYQRILTAMQLAGTIAVIGGVAANGSGIFEIVSIDDAASFVGTGEAILNDTNAVNNLTTNEFKVLDEAIKRFNKALSLSSNDSDIANEILDSKSIIKFYDAADLRTALESLSDDLKFKAFQDFQKIPPEVLALLKENPESIYIWANIDSAGQSNIAQNQLTFLKSFAARDLFIGKQYSEIASLYGKSISNAFESSNLPGIKWVIDSSDLGVYTNNLQFQQALIDANNIALDSTDVATIAGNYGIPVDIVQTVKNHYWIEDHLQLWSDGTFQVGRFGITPDDVSEWQNAIANTLNSDQELQFRRFIAHEYVESKLMEKGLSYRAMVTRFAYDASDFGAHDAAPLINNGTYISLNRLSSPPDPNVTDFGNLNDIVQFLINFYHL